MTRERRSTEGMAIDDTTETSSPAPSPPPLLVLCRDLLLSSKITASARSAGVPFQLVRDPATLSDRRGRGLIVDLNQDGAIDAAAQWLQTTGRPTIGFVSHVDSELMSRAREAGINDVMSRSRFVQRLSEIIESNA